MTKTRIRNACLAGLALVLLAAPVGATTGGIQDPTPKLGNVCANVPGTDWIVGAVQQAAQRAGEQVQVSQPSVAPQEVASGQQTASSMSRRSAEPPQVVQHGFSACASVCSHIQVNMPVDPCRGACPGGIQTTGGVAACGYQTGIAGPCNPGQAGLKPACTALPTLCPGEQVGVDGHCISTNPPPCGFGTIGVTPPACVSHMPCPSGSTGPAQPACIPSGGGGGDCGLKLECFLSMTFATPEVYARPNIDATGSGPVCTGTHRPAVTAKVGATIGGDAIPAKISASVEYTAAEQYDFACDYGLFADAMGQYGFLRHVQVMIYSAINDKFISTPDGSCDYDGVQLETCTTRHKAFLSDTFSGSGVAGPGGLGLPTEVTVCPPKDVGYSMTATNGGWQDLTIQGVTTGGNWDCQAFGIHYQ